MDFPCPHCGGALHIRDGLAGKTGKCSHCGQRITAPSLVGSGGRAAVPGEPVRLPGLNPVAYEHPFDTRALDALQKTPGLGRLVAKLNELSVERLMRIQYTGSNLRVGPACLPQLHGELVATCDVLHLPQLPQLYVEWDDKVDASTAGVKETIIVLTAGCVDRLSEGERAFVVGHEVGHIKSEHVLYHQIGQLLPVLGDIVGSATLGLGELLSKPLELALCHWSRMSELTADRAGLLACQDLGAAVRAFMKMAGLPESLADEADPSSFIAQAREFQGYELDSLDKAARLLLSVDQTHPWTVMRAAELLKWVESGEYQAVIEQFGDRVPTSRGSEDIRFCPACGFDRKPDEAYCSSCGHRIG